MTSMILFMLFTLSVMSINGFSQKSECLLEAAPRHIGEVEADEEPEGHEELLSVHPAGEERKRMGEGEEEEEEENEEGEGRGYRNQGHAMEGPSHVGQSEGHRGRGFLDEEGELEDRRRRHSPDTLTGTLTCPPDATIHVLNVTVGFTVGQHCHQAGCQAGSTKASQVMNCQGLTGSCNIGIHRNYLMRCGQTVNFALVNYECVPAAKKVNICSKTDVEISGAVIVTSPNYPAAASGQQTSGGISTCECTLRAEGGAKLEMEYLRTHLPGTQGHCDGDTLLLERPDIQGRYILEHEICGHNVSNNIIIHDNILRITLLGGSPLQDTKSGFIVKFLASSQSGAATLFHISCNDSTSSTSGTKTIGTTSGKSAARDQVEARIAQARAQSQGHGDTNVDNAVKNEKETDQSSPGVLSGVVAALASVIVIMGSIAAYVIHKRRQRRRQEKEEIERYGTNFVCNEQWYGAGTSGGPSTSTPDPYGTYSLQSLLSKVVVLGKQLIRSGRSETASSDSNTEYSFSSDLVMHSPKTMTHLSQEKPVTCSNKKTLKSIHVQAEPSITAPAPPPRRTKGKHATSDSPYDNADPTTSEVVYLSEKLEASGNASGSEDSAYSEDTTSVNSINTEEMTEGAYNNIQEEHYSTIPEMLAAARTSAVIH
nr:hypothetical protein BgiMline_008272 [Biomphalaria glabrata]